MAKRFAEEKGGKKGLEDEDAEEEFLLKQKMEELDLKSESKAESDDVIKINVVEEKKK